MRSVIFVLFLAWVAAVIGAQLIGGWIAATVTALCAVLLAHKVWPRFEYTIAVLCLVGLATIYAQPQDAANTECSLPTSGAGTVAEVFRIRDTSIQYRVTVETCQVLVTGSRFPQYKEGDVLELAGGTQQSVAELHDELPGYADYLTRRGIDSTWRFADITVREQSRDTDDSWRDVLVQQTQQLFPEPDASIIGAMLFARRGTIPESITESFRTTGTSHILAISGLHVSLIALLLLLVASALPLPRWVRVAFVGIALWLYISGVGAPLSSVRAGIFWTLVAIGYQMRWLISLPTIVVLAVAGLVTLNPSIVHEVGLQLSVSAVTGIFLVVFAAQPVLARVSKLWRWVLTVIFVSLGATLGTLPLVAYHFGTLTLIGVAANVLVVPPVPIVIAGSMLALGVGALAWPLARAIAWLVHLVLLWQLWIIEMLSHVPGVAFVDLSFSARWLPLYYALFLGFIALIIRWQERSWREVWS